MRKIIYVAIVTLVSFSCSQKQDLKGSTLELHSEIDKNLLQVALLVGDGVYNTELVAPMDLFQHTIFHTSPGMAVYTVAPSESPITTFEGLKIIPDYSFLNCPKVDVLVIPSAEHHLDTDLENESLISFVQEKAAEAQFVISLCDGAFVLAKAGLLDDKVSTTFPGDLQAYKERFPQLDVREDVSFVHDGKFMTSAGGVKSFDVAMYLVEMLYGPKAAAGVAKGLIIDWKPEEVAHIII